jgi:hypothetical protein
VSKRTDANTKAVVAVKEQLLPGLQADIRHRDDKILEEISSLSERVAVLNQTLIRRTETLLEDTVVNPLLDRAQTTYIKFLQELQVMHLRLGNGMLHSIEIGIPRMIYNVLHTVLSPDMLQRDAHSFESHIGTSEESWYRLLPRIGLPPNEKDEINPGPLDLGWENKENEPAPLLTVSEDKLQHTLNERKQELQRNVTEAINRELGELSSMVKESVSKIVQSGIASVQEELQRERQRAFYPQDFTYMASWVREMSNAFGGSSSPASNLNIDRMRHAQELYEAANADETPRGFHGAASERGGSGMLAPSSRTMPALQMRRETCTRLYLMFLRTTIN